MAVYFKCKACGGEHRSPIGFGDKRSFETATLNNNVFQCPITGKGHSYNKADMFWKEDTKKF